MTSPNSELLDQALGDLARKRQQLAEMREQLNSVSSTVTAPRQVVTVTVGRHGEITDLKFPTSAYKRMAPAELASVVLKTIGEAREKTLKQTAELMAPMLPPGLSAEALLQGKVPSLTDIVPSHDVHAAESFFEREVNSRGQR